MRSATRSSSWARFVSNSALSRPIVASGLSADEKILLDGIQSVKEDEKIESKFIPSMEVLAGLQLIKQ